MKKSERKAKIRNLYIQVPHLTRNTIWENDKNTSKHNIQESQEVSPFSAGYHKAARNIQDSITKTKMRHTKGSAEKSHEGFNLPVGGETANHVNFMQPMLITCS